MSKTKIKSGKGKRMFLSVGRDMLESTQFKNCFTPMADKVSGQRLQIVQSQFESMVIPVDAEMPLVQSAMIQDILTKSTSIKPITGDLTLLKTFIYQDLTYYIFRLNGIVDVHIDDKYVDNNGFSAEIKTDFSSIEEGVKYDLDQSSVFYKSYIKQFDPISETVAYGANASCIISTDLDNVQDSVGVSRRFASRFTTLKPKCVNIHLNKKRIISKHPGIFPKLGEFIDNPLLFKIVKDDNTVASLAQDPLSPVGYEDDSINLEPLTYINRIEIYSNNDIHDPILNKYREDLLQFREDIYEFVTSLNEPLSDVLSIIRSNFGHAKFRDRNIDLKDPLIKIYTKTISVTETECKFKWTLYMVTCARNLVKSWNAVKTTYLVS